MKATIFRHSANKIGTFPATLKMAGVEVTLLDTWLTDVPDGFDPLAPDILIVMGGAPGTYQTDLFPFLTQELKVLEKRLAADKPTLGVCLGAQMMAKVLSGSDGYLGKSIGKTPERGWYPLKVNEAGMKTSAKHLDGGVTHVAESHQDTFDLPPDVTLLASSDLYPNQIFSHGRNALAVQCHPEADEETCRGWYVSYAGAVKDKAEMDAWRADTAKHLPTMMKQSEKWLTEWIASVTSQKETRVA